MADLAGGSPRVDELCGLGDSYLLLPDACNPGSFTRKPLYDYRAEVTKDGKYFGDVHEGPILLEADALVYWA